MRLTQQHQELGGNGVGKCSVPMWCNGMPAGFCDEPAYGKQEPEQRRYGEWSYAWRKWFGGYCTGLACHAHGGPLAPPKPSCPECGRVHFVLECDRDEDGSKTAEWNHCEICGHNWTWAINPPKVLAVDVEEKP